MSHVDRERPRSQVRFLAKAEAVSGSHSVVPVISANTSDAYYVVRAPASVWDSLASLCVSNGTSVAYSLTVPTSDVWEEYDPEMVAALLKADAEQPEATFADVIDMMEWLNRD
jgi:hypothetical protein